MGYTHYWDQKRAFTKDEWAHISEGAKRILAQEQDKGVSICGGLGTGSPKVDSRKIVFNGNKNLRTEDGGDDLAHETFSLKRVFSKKAAGFNFCKTAYKPYDRAVTSILALAKEIAPAAIDIRSDGGEEVFYPENTTRPAHNAVTIAVDAVKIAKKHAEDGEKEHAISAIETAVNRLSEIPLYTASIASKWLNTAKGLLDANNGEAVKNLDRCILALDRVFRF